MNLDQFIASSERNLHVLEPGLEYYVRKSLAFPGAIELATCVAKGPPGQLGLWRFLKKYAARVPFEAEQVINPRVAAYFRQLRWLERDLGGTPQFASPLLARRYAGTKHFEHRYGELK